MLINTDKNILIIGLGLIGGSYAKSLHKTGFKISAIDNRKASIEYALNEGFIDCGAAFPDPEIIGEADIVIFALYPRLFKEWIRDYQHLFKSGAYITDVTGVKSCIVDDIQNILREDLEFISGHPMAGRESSGVENSDDSVFYGSNFIIVPTEKNTREAIDVCRELALIMRFGRISVLSPEQHDEMIGFVSQLTHCIAVSLMNCSDNEHLVDYVGDSFRDLTRIARINENMWSELFILNKPSLIKEMDQFIEEISELRNMIAEEDVDGMKSKMINSTSRRALFDRK